MAKKGTGAAATRTARMPPIPRRRAAGAAAPSGAAADSTPRQPTHDEIAAAAYRRYLSRGGQDGADFDDWVEAERELRALKS